MIGQVRGKVAEVTEQLVVDLVREVVAAVHPEELGRMEQVSLAFAEDRDTAPRVPPHRGRPTVTSPRTATSHFAAVALVVGADLCARLTGRSSWFRRAPHASLAAVVPPLPAAEVERLEGVLAAAAVDRGLAEPEAAELARTMIDLWPRA